MWYVYAIYNKENSQIYIGQTSNIDRRLSEHNRKIGNHFTAKYNGDWNLIYAEECYSRRDALKREKELKSYQGRMFIKTYIPK